jgi:hypothetical protein
MFLKRGFAETAITAQPRHRHPLIGLCEELDDCFFAKSAFVRVRRSPSRSGSPALPNGMPHRGTGQNGKTKFQVWGKHYDESRSQGALN